MERQEKICGLNDSLAWWQVESCFNSASVLEDIEGSDMGRGERVQRLIVSACYASIVKS